MDTFPWWIYVLFKLLYKTDTSLLGPTLQKDVDTLQVQ